MQNNIPRWLHVGKGLPKQASVELIDKDAAGPPLKIQIIYRDGKALVNIHNWRDGVEAFDLAINALMERPEFKKATFFDADTRQAIVTNGKWERSKSGLGVGNIRSVAPVETEGPAAQQIAGPKVGPAELEGPKLKNQMV